MHREDCPAHPNYINYMVERSYGPMDLGTGACDCNNLDSRINALKIVLQAELSIDGQSRLKRLLELIEEKRHK